ncbi:MAG: ATP-binding protein, partial [Spirulinaceae cyanobacterium]
EQKQLIEILEAQQGKFLNDSEKAVLQGMLAGQTYEVVSKEIPLDYNYVRQIGSKLVKDIGEILNKKVTKNTLAAAVEQLLGQQLKQEPKSQPLNLDNPFIPTSGIIETPQLFFNREKEIKDIFELLNSRSSVAVIGERQVGKSSLLQAIFRQAETQLQPPRRPIYLHLQGISNEEDFYAYLCDEIDIPLQTGYQLTRALKKQHLLLLIDEIEKMNGPGFTRDVREKLRSLAEGENAPLRLVVAARTPLTELFPDDEPGKTSPLANICPPVEVPIWPEKTARDFIQSRLAMSPLSSTITFSDSEIESLLKESNCHPQKLTRLCNKLYSSKKGEI